MCSVAPEYYRRLQARGPPRRASARDPDLAAAETEARRLVHEHLTTEYRLAMGKLSVMRAATDAAEAMTAQIARKREAMERRLLAAATRASVDGDFREAARLERIIERLDAEIAQLAGAVGDEGRKFFEHVHAYNAQAAADKICALGAWCP
jgi:hypothetical protein